MRALILLTALLSITLTPGCFTASSPYNVGKKHMNKEAFPKDLASPEHVLLVLKWDRTFAQGRGDDKGIINYNEKIEKNVSELKIPAIAVTREELKSEKYSDTNKYRYLLHPGNWRRFFTDGGAISDLMHMYYTDRKDNKTYPSTNYDTNNYIYGIKCAVSHYYP